MPAPIVIGRDHLDAGSVASPTRETENMRDGSDAIADWPVLNALLNASSGATWVSVHHGGGVGIGYSLHAGMVDRRRRHRRGRRETRARAHLRSRPRRRCGTPTPATLKRWLRPRAEAFECPCERNAHADSPLHADSPHRRRARRVAVPHSRARRRVRQRAHDGAAPAARPHRPHARPARRRRAHGDHARAVSAGGDRRIAVPGGRRRCADDAPRRVRSARSASSTRTRAGGSEPATFLLDEFLELRTFESFPGLRRVLHDLVDGLGTQRQPFRPDQPLHGARASAAARSIGAV